MKSQKEVWVVNVWQEVLVECSNPDSAVAAVKKRFKNMRVGSMFKLNKEQTEGLKLRPI